MSDFDDFCKVIDINKLTKLEKAIAFIWYNEKSNGIIESDVNTINNFFSQASLSKYNQTYLKRDLSKSKKIIKGSNNGSFRLSRTTKESFENKLGHFFLIEDVTVESNLNLLNSPYLSEEDINSARKMAELYLIIHCYENSVRKLIETILKNSLGINWWDDASSAGMKRKFADRKAKEEKNKWLSPRGNNSSPLYYLDWSDLVTIIRKYPEEFSIHIHDIKFVELRLEELEKIRNIVAHNGIIPSGDDFQRVILSFKDWCKQVS